MSVVAIAVRSPVMMTVGVATRAAIVARSPAMMTAAARVVTMTVAGSTVTRARNASVTCTPARFPVQTSPTPLATSWRANCPWECGPN